MFDVVTEKLFARGPIYRKLQSAQNNIYLTFDDGPCPELTPRVLAILKAAKCQATFFLVASQARVYPEIVHAIVEGGHSIGNHSLDHTYRPLFSGLAAMNDWIKESERVLEDVSGVRSVGFRPPNGVITPHICAAAQDLGLPLYLWTHRFYDTLYTFKKEKALDCIERLRAGDIVLLHDRQQSRHHDLFLESLRVFLDACTTSGWTLAPLPLRLPLS